MPAHHGSEAVAPGEADAVHVRDACEERRVMHQHESRHVAFFGQGGVEPGQPLSAKLAAALTRNNGIEADESQRSTLDNVLQEAVRRR